MSASKLTPQPHVETAKKTRTLPKEAEPYKWKKGQSGNPAGRPKGLVGMALFKQLCKREGADLLGIVKGILTSAKKGNPKAFAVIRDSVDGRPALPIELDVTGTLKIAEMLRAARKNG